jgi:hypothetical protein
MRCDKVFISAENFEAECGRKQRIFYIVSEYGDDDEKNKFSNCLIMLQISNIEMVYDFYGRC